MSGYRVTHENEAKLIRQAQEGSATAFETLVRLFQTKVYNLAFRFLGNKEDAEDVAQETFVKAFRAIGGFKGQSKFYTWLFRIAYHQTVNHRRKKKPALSLDLKIGNSSSADFLLPSYEDNPGKRLEAEENKAELELALEQLPLDFRACLLLKEMEGLSYEEISQAIGIPLGTVRSRLHRARMELRRILEDS
ncbi:MAG: sigma-70 family RNA polymerase sigma factor [Gemmataceae bacterium]|nr:sigma-70 family RNA polymerase sigma factor [Gemmataceae bacterium]